MQQKFEIGQIVVLAKHGPNYEGGLEWTRHLSRPYIGAEYKVTGHYNGTDVDGLGCVIDSEKEDDNGYIISNNLLILKTWI